MIFKFKRLIKSTIALLTFTLAATGSVSAQLGDIGSFLKAGKDDATLLMREYLRPFPTGFGTGLNAGWTESAAPKKLFGFSVQFRPSIAMVPNSARSFDISALGLQKIDVAAGESPVTQTISGKRQSGPELVVREDVDNDGTEEELSRFTMPGGTGLHFVPAPILQASIGLVKKTDITLRYMPEITFGDYGGLGITGVAVKHEVSQWLPGSKLIPVDISVMAGFTQIRANAGLNMDPEGLPDPTDPNSVATTDFDNQEVVTQTNSFVANILAGKTLPFITAYAGLGYQQAKFNLDVEGNYPVPVTPNFYRVQNDPVSFSIESNSNFHALAGFRVKLAVLAIYGEITMADYVTANAGIGISFR